MVQLLQLCLVELVRCRRLLPFYLGRRFRRFQQSQRPGSTQTAAGSLRGRGLHLSWYAPQLGYTLLSRMSTKTYRLGFDPRLSRWKRLARLRVWQRVAWKHYRAAVGGWAGTWRGGLLAREFGVWGGVEAYQWVVRGGVLAAVAAVGAPQRRQLGLLGSHTSLAWAWAGCVGVGEESFSTLLPWLIVTEVDDWTPQITALLWHEPYDSFAFMGSEWEAWSLEEGGVPRYLLPAAVVLWATAAGLEEFQNTWLPLSSPEGGWIAMRGVIGSMVGTLQTKGVMPQVAHLWGSQLLLVG